MMKSRRNAHVAAFAVFTVCGCAPLQQAPLVYSSKVAVGIDLSSNATENPGVSISLGVKVIDSAYVPIAVSKEADPKVPAGAASTPDIIRIYAQYGQGINGGDAKQLTEVNKQKINAYIDARKAAADAIELRRRAEEALVNLKKKQMSVQSAIKTIDNLGPRPQIPPDAALAAMSAASANEATQVASAAIAMREDLIQKNVNPQLADIQDPSISPVPKGTTDLSTVRASLQAMLTQIGASLTGQTTATNDAALDEKEKAARADQLFQQAAQAASLLETSKTDAMSVYGRFDSNGKAEVPAGAASNASAGLLVGKVFSTGLASQNLTEAAKVAAISTCISNALTAAGAASGATGSEKSTMITALSAACSADIKNR